MFLIAQHRKKLLLTVTERTAIGYHPATQYLVFIIHGKSEIHSDCLSGSYREFLFLRADNFFRHWVEKNHTDCTCLWIACHIGDRSGNRRLVAYTDEAREIRSQHKFLARGSFTIQRSRQHSFGMGISTKVPTSQTFGHSEREGYFSPFIRTKLRIEESCFGKVRTQVGGYIRKGFFFKFRISSLRD